LAVEQAQQHKLVAVEQADKLAVEQAHIQVQLQANSIESKALNRYRL
jgi:hypothetical protein